jgi:hypothetical protein
MDGRQRPVKTIVNTALAGADGNVTAAASLLKKTCATPR